MSWLDDNYKLLVLILLSAIIFLLTFFFIIGALAVNEVQELKEGFDIPDFSGINEAIDEAKELIDSLSEYKELLDELPIEDMLNRLNNINAFDKFIWKINQWG